MANPKKDYRIVVVGEEGVGKTSLITSLISKRFQKNPPPVLAPARLPPGMISSEPITTYLIDTSCGALHSNKLEEEISKADSIIIVYDIERPKTYERIRDHWIPEIRRIRSRKDTIIPPIIIAANKKDLSKNLKDSYFEDTQAKLLQNFHEIDVILACSANTLEYVPELFQLSQKAILYPAKPLFDKTEKKLRKKAVTALKRIFRIADKDNDEFLNDTEFLNFMTNTLEVDFQSDKLSKIKSQIKSRIEDGVSEKGISLFGFIAFNHILIGTGTFEYVWKILRKYGYGDDLNLKEDYLNPRMNITKDNSCELSSKGIQFLNTLFKNYDKDQDGELSPNELMELFTDTPGIPSLFPSSGNINLHKFLCYWNMITFLDYRTALSYFVYFGYEPDVRETISIKRGRKEDTRKKEIQKNIFLFYIFGSSKCGKTTVLYSLIDKQKDELTPLNAQANILVNSFKDPDKQTDRYIIAEKIVQSNEIENRDKMEKCDLFCFLYDGHDEKSFSYIEYLEKYRYENYPDIPSVIICTKADLPKAIQQSYTPPQDFCNQRGLTRLEVSKSTLSSDVYKSLLKDLFERHKGRSFTTPIILTVSVGIGLAAVYCWYKFKK